MSTIRVGENENLESALRRFKRKCSRDGIHPKALAKIIDYGVNRLVYISCKPTSLARDLKVFLENGYRLERMTCVDMFCESVHCETCVLLSKLDIEQRMEV